MLLMFFHAGFILRSAGIDGPDLLDDEPNLLNVAE